MLCFNRRRLDFIHLFNPSIPKKGANFRVYFSPLRTFSPLYTHSYVCTCVCVRSSWCEALDRYIRTLLYMNTWSRPRPNILTLSNAGDSNQLDLEGSLFIGSVDYMDPYLKLPPSLWSGTLRYGFVGCLKDLFINGASYDVVTYAHQQDVGKSNRISWLIDGMHSLFIGQYIYNKALNESWVDACYSAGRV